MNISLQKMNKNCDTHIHNVSYKTLKNLNHPNWQYIKKKRKKEEIWIIKKMPTRWKLTYLQVYNVSTHYTVFSPHTHFTANCAKRRALLFWGFLSVCVCHTATHHSDEYSVTAL